MIVQNLKLGRCSANNNVHSDSTCVFQARSIGSGTAAPLFIDTTEKHGSTANGLYTLNATLEVKQLVNAKHATCNSSDADVKLQTNTDCYVAC